MISTLDPERITYHSSDEFLLKSQRSRLSRLVLGVADASCDQAWIGILSRAHLLGEPHHMISTLGSERITYHSSKDQLLLHPKGTGGFV